MVASYFPDEFRLAQPLLIRADFILHHGGKRIHLVRQPPDNRNAGDKVDEIQKGRAPGLHKQYSAILSQNALHLGEGLLQVRGQVGKMMQTALDDEHVFAAMGERKLPAVAYHTFRGALVLSNQSGRKVNASQARKPEAMQCD